MVVRPRGLGLGEGGHWPSFQLPSSILFFFRSQQCKNSAYCVLPGREGQVSGVETPNRSGRAAGHQPEATQLDMAEKG
jgi:hypothetical protein